MTKITLNGVGWDHPRCSGPLDASIARYAAVAPDVAISWRYRSLYEFGEGRLEQLLDTCDLVIFDHPFAGEAARGGVLLDLAPYLGTEAVAAFEAESVGPSFRSYRHGGGLYGLPIDTAAQVSALRPDLLARVGAEVPRRFDDVLALAEAARAHGLWVAAPVKPTDAMCLMMTLAANAGHPPAADPCLFLAPDIGVEILDRLKTLVARLHPGSRSWNPIQCLDHATSTDEVAYIPYSFGYTNYAQLAGDRRLRFADIPALGNRGCAGSVLGGAGVGVLASTRHTEAAVAYARWLCSPACQRSWYVAAGGQPASRSAWTDARADSMAGGFFSATLATHDQAYLRPTVPGFVPFFRTATEIVHGFLFDGAGEARNTVDRLNRLFVQQTAR